MTTLALRVRRRLDLRSWLLILTFAVWTFVTIAGWYGYLPVEPLLLFIFLTPLVLILWALLQRSENPVLPLVAGGSFAVLVALITPAITVETPLFAVIIPALVIGALATQRWPTASLALVFTITGIYGSFTAFTGFPIARVREAIIVALWAGVIGQFLIGRRSRTVRWTPAAVMLAAYMLMTLAAVLATQPFGNATVGIRLMPMFFSGLLLVGYGGLPRESLEKAARIFVPVCLVVAAYATLRWAIGTAGKEKAVQTSLEQQYNQIGTTGETKTQGSLPNGHLLGLWMAMTIPFLVAMALGTWKRTRVIAIAALPFSGIGLLASGQRTALAATLAGAVMVVVVHQLSRGYKGPRLGVAVAAALTLIIGAAAVYPAVVNNPEKRKRYSNLLRPSQDDSFQVRLEKWRATLRELGGHPFGHGIGSASSHVVPHRFSDIAAYDIDNSYLMVAWEQGIAIAIFFIATMLVLLTELLRHAVWTRGPTSAALTAAATGTFVAMLAEFMAANYNTQRIILVGWMIVGIGVAQFASLDPAQRPVEP